MTWVSVLKEYKFLIKIRIKKKKPTMKDQRPTKKYSSDKLTLVSNLTIFLFFLSFKL